MATTVCTSTAGRDAELVFQAALEAVRGDVLVRKAVKAVGERLSFAKCEIRLKPGGRIVVIGAGKAAGHMAVGLLDVLHQSTIEGNRISGWVNVPDDGVVDAPPLTIFGCRPTGENLPTRKAIDGTHEIIRLVRALGPDDLCICLISGGGSALLSLPVDDIAIDDKRQLVRCLDSSGASIQARNRIRRELSQVKGGRLARIQTHGTLVTLVISDILGDPLELIASGPTIPSLADPAGALDLLEAIAIPDGRSDPVPQAVWNYLRKQARTDKSTDAGRLLIANENQHAMMIGNLASAVDAAADRARVMDYQVETRIQSNPSELVSEAANRLTSWIMRPESGPRILVDGGEPVIQLSAKPGRGGRNQQLVLEIANQLMQRNFQPREFCLLSGGTDGEDGNTAVAGAIFDHSLLERWIQQGVKPYPYLIRNDAFSFFEQFHGLLSSGMTGTNVGDLRIAIVR